MKFYDNKGSHVNKNARIDSDCTDDRQSSSSDMETCDSEFDCKWAKVYNQCDKIKVKTSMPIKSQIVVMSSREMPPSSDESDTIDVSTDSVQELFGNIKVEPILVEIMDDLMDNNLDDTDETIIVTLLYSPVFLTCLVQSIKNGLCIVVNNKCIFIQ